MPACTVYCKATLASLCGLTPKLRGPAGRTSTMIILETHRYQKCRGRSSSRVRPSADGVGHLFARQAPGFRNTCSKECIDQLGITMSSLPQIDVTGDMPPQAARLARKFGPWPIKVSTSGRARGSTTAGWGAFIARIATSRGKFSNAKFEENCLTEAVRQPQGSSDGQVRRSASSVGSWPSQAQFLDRVHRPNDDDKEGDE